MTTPTDTTEKTYGLFRSDVTSFTTDYLLQPTTYSTESKANEALTILKKQLTAALQNAVMIHEVE
jgi:hypothetical protein